MSSITVYAYNHIYECIKKHDQTLPVLLVESKHTLLIHFYGFVAS